MKHAILIPCRDESTKLTKTLESLAEYEKTGPTVHYYFIENNSKDNTLELITNFMKGRRGCVQTPDLSELGDSRIGKDFTRLKRMVEVRNRLLDSVMGSGVKYDYISFVDSGVSFTPSDLQSLVRRLEKRPDIAMVIPFGYSKSLKRDFDILHYYDTLAFSNYRGTHCLKTDMTCLYKECKYCRDRIKWGLSHPTITPEDYFKIDSYINVNSGFGGLNVFRANLVSKVRFDNRSICEWHVFCNMISGYGRIVMCADIQIPLDEDYLTEPDSEAMERFRKEREQTKP